MEYTHSRFGNCEISEVTQGQLETWQDAVKDATKDPLAVFYGKCVRAAIRAKILIAPVLTDEQIAAEKPGKIHWLANSIAQAIDEASNIDPL